MATRTQTERIQYEAMLEQRVRDCAVKKGEGMPVKREATGHYVVCPNLSRSDTDIVSCPFATPVGDQCYCDPTKHGQGTYR